MTWFLLVSLPSRPDSKLVAEFLSDHSCYLSSKIESNPIWLTQKCLPAIFRISGGEQPWPWSVFGKGSWFVRK